MNSLIANSGLHFKIIEKELNLDEPLLIDGGKTLKYTFIEAIDFLNDCRVRFDVCAPHNGVFSAVNYLRVNELFELSPNGTVVLDQCGVPCIKQKGVSKAVIEYFETNAPELTSINSLNSYRIKRDGDNITAFELLLGKWLPMPMYETEISGQTTGFPNGWCRVRIDRIGEKRNNGSQRLRFTWAFDTRLADNAGDGLLRPAFLEGSGDRKEYQLCNRVDQLLGTFLNIPDGKNDAPVGDYLVSLLGLDLSQDTPHKYKFLGFYIYLINYLRLSGASPEITLYNKKLAITEENKHESIPVDMSVDIGNSRTCAVLFERGDFTKARMLRIRDLSEPWHTYENAFDMQVVFRRADFGGDLTLEKSLFQWMSLVRVGEEAKHLIYKSLEDIGEGEKNTHMSSPKRYLWDDMPYDKRWELMVTEDDPTTLKISPQIYLEGFTDHFDDNGDFLAKPKEIDIFNLGHDDKKQNHYSRRSLMTFVMIEILQQALCYINSSKFRDMHGQIGIRRHLRNIIITCPTAMPVKEQYTLRKAAADAVSLLRKLDPTLPEVTITPSPDKLQSSDDPVWLAERGWLYDEAFASQLVYLYAELTKRYGGRVDHFFELKGHERVDMKEYGFEGKHLTIGTIDIGAGTTDVMITSYGRNGKGRITPVPLYYDSFYSAGDDILYNIIRDVILEGVGTNDESMGSIGTSLAQRISRMTPDELMQIPRIKETKEYRERIDDIRNALNEESAAKFKRHLTGELMNHFFGDDAAFMSEKDRRSRLEFAIQISIPIAQFFLELLKQGRPANIYTFDELFPKQRPAEYLLQHFRDHFGFGFEELKWRFDPEEIGTIVRTTMEPLLKSLSVIMYAYNCDTIVLSGRPTNLTPLTDLMYKYLRKMPQIVARIHYASRIQLRCR